jgi:hypothetical protein
MATHSFAVDSKIEARIWPMTIFSRSNPDFVVAIYGRISH